MDQVFDALSAELPYDRVSNLANTSIQSYKDGKDRSLLGGQTDVNDKSALIDRFYDKLKAELERHHGTNDDGVLERYGTSIGKYLFTLDKDMVEASENFSYSVESLGGFISDDKIRNLTETTLKNIVTQALVYIKLNNDVLKGEDKTFSPYRKDISDSLKNNNKKISDILALIPKNDRTVKNAYIPKDMTNMSDYLRDALIAVLPCTKSNYKYYTRYSLRYKAFAEIVKKECDALLSFSNTKDVEKLSEVGVKIKKDFDVITHPDGKLAMSSDPFTVKLRNYVMNFTSFYISYSIKDAQDDYGIHLSDYLKSEKFEGAFNMNDPNKYVFTSIKSSSPVSTIKDKLYADDMIGSGKINLSNAKNIDLDVMNIVGDMTIGEFYSQVEKFKNATDSLDDYLKSTIRTNLTLENDMFNKIANTSRLIAKEITKAIKPDAKVERKQLNMVSTGSFCILTDLMSAIESLEISNAIDNLRKIQMYYLTTSLIKCLDGILRSALGE